jgi:hypothetical protein
LRSRAEPNNAVSARVGGGFGCAVRGHDEAAGRVVREEGGGGVAGGDEEGGRIPASHAGADDSLKLG